MKFQTGKKRRAKLMWRFNFSVHVIMKFRKKKHCY